MFFICKYSVRTQLTHFLTATGVIFMQRSFLGLHKELQHIRSHNSFSLSGCNRIEHQRCEELSDLCRHQTDGQFLNKGQKFFITYCKQTAWNFDIWAMQSYK